MKRRHVAISGVLAFVAGGVLAGFTGCSPTLLQNLTAERTGNVTIQFINNTPFRAAFSYGSYDAWDKSPGPVDLQQLRLEAHTTSAAATVTCRRNVAVGTQDFVKRVLDTKTDQSTANFDADAFDSVVHFSSAPTDSTGAALPSAGTALGVEKLLGVNFGCANELIFTFVQDPDATGGFRIDFEVIRDKPVQ